MIYSIEKASVMKRFFAFLLDAILLSILATGFSYLTAVVTKIDNHQAKLQEYYAYYERTYDVKFGLTQEEINNLTEEELAHYKEVEDLLKSDQEFIDEYNMVKKLALLIGFVGTIIATMIVEFVIPLILKNGQTVGKKVFSLCLVKKNAVKVSHVQLFARALIGKFAFEMMIPIYLVVSILYGFGGYLGLILTIALFITQIILLFVTKYRTLLHDIIAFTVVVDKQSQMIFNSEDELLKYKEKEHKESTKKSVY